VASQRSLGNLLRPNLSGANQRIDFGKKRYVETAETIARVEEGVHRRINELWAEGGLEAVDRRKVHVVVRGGKAAVEILAFAQEKSADVIVIGSSG